MNPEILIKLGDVLAYLYTDDASLRATITVAGLDAARIELNSTAANNWQAVLLKAEKVGRVEALLAVVAGEYGDNPQFRQAYDAYRAAYPQRQTPIGGRANDQHRRISHSILPWLVDRDRQMDELRAAFRQLQARPGRPVICVLHGDDQECHDKFVDRLKEVALADLLPGLRAKGPIRQIPLDWPMYTQTIGELHDKLMMRLAEAVEDIQASLTQINTNLSASPVLIETYLLIQEWSAQTQEQINGFVQFWQEWPQLIPGQYLIICLCVKCIKPKNNFWDFLRRRNIIQVINEVERALHDPSYFTFERYDRVFCKVLPRLQAVTLQEAHNWPRLEDVRRHCPERNLQADLKAIFDDDPTKAISMSELGQRLGELLTMIAPDSEVER